jgi:ABC-2 type transport system permease protein
MKKENKLFSKALFKQSCKANGVMWGSITFAVCFMLACVMLISGTSSISAVKEGVETTIVEQAINATIKKSAVSEYDQSVNGEELFDKEFTVKFNEINTLETYTNSYVSELASLIASYVSTDESKEAIASEVKTSVTEYMNSDSAKLKITEYMMTGLSKDEAVAKLQEEKVNEYTASVTAEHVEKAKANADLQSEAFVKVYLTPSYTYAINKVIDEYGSSSSPVVTINPSNKADDVYVKYGEEIPEEYVSDLTSYMMSDVMSVASGGASTALADYIISEERASFRQTRAYEATSMLVGGKMNEEETIDEIIANLADYGISKEKYDEMGFTYSYVKKTAYEASLEYQDKLTYEISLLDDDLAAEEYEAKVASIKQDLNVSVAGSLLDKLPEDVSSGIEELGQMDLYGLIVGSIFFKMAGLLLPIIYMIMASNNLIAGQVDSGSMAYVLSTSTKRRQVTFTQGLFLSLSLLAMFVATSITSVVCFSIINVNTDLTIGKLLLMNLGAFITLFAMSGINFLTSCYFDRSKKAMAIGGGLSMFFLVATMLGLFGSPVIPSVVRISALNYFNYVSIISLFDVVSILDGGTAWIWKMAILLIIGLLGYILGDLKFKKKDLPL